MKKLIAWLLCLCMLAGCLAGCDKESEEQAPTLIGTWEVILDGTDLLNQTLDAQLGEFGKHIQLRNLFIPLEMTFGEDGIVHITANPKDIQAFAAAARQQLRLGYRAFAQAALGQQAIDMSLEEFEAFQDFSVDALLDNCLSEEFLAELAAGLTQESMPYTAEETTLYLGENKSAFTYTMDGNDLILEPTGSAAQALALAEELSVLPANFTRMTDNYQTLQSLTGTWQTEIDLAQYFSELLAPTLSDTAPFVSFHDLSLTLLITVQPDGGFEVRVDPGSAHMLIGDLHAQTAAGLQAYTQHIIDGTDSTMTAEEYLRSQGFTFHQLAENTFARSDILNLLEAFSLELSTFVMGDQLLTADDGNTVSLDFTMENNRLTLLSASGTEGGIFAFLPLVCTPHESRDPAALVGRWHSRLDLTEELNTKMSAADVNLSKYLVFTDLGLDIAVLLAEDGTFTAAYTDASVTALIAALDQQLIAGMEAYLRAQLAEAGYEGTLEEALASQNTTLEELVHASLDPAELTKSLISNQSSGTYTATDYQLTFTYGGEASMAYYIRENTLYLFPDSTGDAAGFEIFAPFSLTRAN